ncbi:SANT/Myb-like DNA-binding domain-containing protein [Mechercharimyces sp. CAU 1602]|uniref:SANT/Myb-like DNA-binding domain-containing protein n=1 Tax=Mechercharimyces sp. CAU 1602 TaxID=2973933 RepID=UPI0021636AA1|nr:SANT/Myb-like DNA-binding domain-containing protein [Mechercharimyces sp. CAU 1602]MCS1350098.1 SANT/Myb-like DNA-binding domain-containing protein [Mechercharimyces sp. CAU 1602]
MARPWSNEEDRLLLQFVQVGRRSGLDRTKIFDKISERLGRSANACYKRWKYLTSTVSSNSEQDVRSEIQHWQSRIERLEKLIENNHEQMQQLADESKKLRKEMKFFEMMLIEEYNLLLKLIEPQNPSVRLQSI